MTCERYLCWYVNTVIATVWSCFVLNASNINQQFSLTDIAWHSSTDAPKWMDCGYSAKQPWCTSLFAFWIKPMFLNNTLVISHGDIPEWYCRVISQGDIPEWYSWYFLMATVIPYSFWRPHIWTTTFSFLKPRHDRLISFKIIHKKRKKKKSSHF